MRLINADKLKELLEARCDKGDEEIDRGYNLGIEAAIALLDAAPTIARTERPFVMLNGNAIYITQGHIDAMIEYERKEQVKEVVERLMKSFEDVQTWEEENNGLSL